MTFADSTTINSTTIKGIPFYNTSFVLKEKGKLIVISIQAVTVLQAKPYSSQGYYYAKGHYIF